MVDKSPKTESQYENRKKENKEHLSASTKETRIARSRSHSHSCLNKLDNEIKKNSPKKIKTFEHSKEVLLLLFLGTSISNFKYFQSITEMSAESKLWFWQRV